MNLFALDGRVALVTGGNRGLGLAMARALREAGAEVVVTGRDASANAAVAGELVVKQLDVRDDDAVESVIGGVIDDLGRLDILVTNAGIYRDQTVLDFDRGSWDEVLATNLTATVTCARAAAVPMARQHSGKIVTVGSMYSAFGHPSSVGYAASKAGVLGATRALACELGQHGIQVNAILPGWFPTDMNGDLPHEERGAAIRRRTPAGRWGCAGDLAGAVVFLASRASDFVTGVALPVDGGYLVSDRELVA